MPSPARGGGSYEVQVSCVDQSGAVVGTFGREGEGPGEFESLSDVLGGPDGTVGALDIGNDRFGVYEPSGTLLTEVPLPGAAVGLSPIRRFAETLAGVAITVFDPAAMQAGAGPGGYMTLFEVDIASAELVREEEVPPVDAEVECGRILYGFPNPGGGWVFIACEGHLVFVGAAATAGRPGRNRRARGRLVRSERVAVRIPAVHPMTPSLVIHEY